jgi:DNA-binding response OmpR family regulator
MRLFEKATHSLPKETGDVQKSILIVDDETSVRELLTRFFEGEQFEVWQAADGNEAMHMVGKRPFDVVVTDLKMPGPDGIEVLRQIRHVSPETVVLILTAYPTPDTTVKALELFSDGYISKPVSLKQLKTVVTERLAVRNWEKTGPARS